MTTDANSAGPDDGRPGERDRQRRDRTEPPDDRAVRSDAGSEGGDPMCWAHLVCEECGAIVTDGHRDFCSAAATG